MPATASAVSRADDWAWALDARAAGDFAQYAGQHVVVTGRKLITAHPDAEVALVQAAAATGVPRSDLVVLYIDQPGTEGWLHVR